ncbi:hypothetical protein GCM10022255_060520 [Dactylosporangium darangshiense]|uniref:Serine/threonine protein kinase n=1 Tax=Dactylosporangium darangshiense TaxID=579108 RepID=A0ABP8DFG0_9ACTN
MEPGHPARHDPPTEHSHDQVNGSPPRPKSRRGWMSDSPLDGGSGWPTSAYAIVPRQPAGPDSAAQPPPPAAPPAEEPQPVAPGSRKGRIAVLLIGLIVLVIAAVGGVLASRDNADSAKTGADATTATTPAPDPTTGEPVVAVADPAASASGGASGAPAGSSASGSAAASASAGTSAEATVPAAPPSTTILRTGTAQVAVLAGKPDDAYDFDSGAKQTAGADVTAGVIGLSAANGAKFAVLVGADTPSLAACSAVPEGQWIGQVLLASLLPGSKVCLRTSEGRYAWFMTRAGDVVNGALYTANLDFIVYKKAGE